MEGKIVCKLSLIGRGNFYVVGIFVVGIFVVWIFVVGIFMSGRKLICATLHKISIHRRAQPVSAGYS